MERNEIVSTRVFVDPSKVGIRRRGFNEYQEKTHASNNNDLPNEYQEKTHASNNNDLPVNNTRDTGSRRNTWIKVGCVVLCLLLGFIITDKPSPKPPTTSIAIKVNGTSWKYQSQLEKWGPVEVHELDVPKDVQVIRSYEYIDQYKDVIIGSELRAELESYHDTIIVSKCSNELLRYNDMEEYSHSVEECYSHGGCETRDVYKKISVPEYHHVCRDVPKFIPRTRTVMKSHDIVKSEPVMKTKYVYMTEKWSFHDSINNSSEILVTGEKTEKLTPVNYIPGENERITGEKWNYFFHLADGTSHEIDYDNAHIFLANSTAKFIAHVDPRTKVVTKVEHV